MKALDGGEVGQGSWERPMSLTWRPTAAGRHGGKATLRGIQWRRPVLDASGVVGWLAFGWVGGGWQ